MKDSGTCRATALGDEGEQTQIGVVGIEEECPFEPAELLLARVIGSVSWYAGITSSANGPSHRTVSVRA